MRLRPKFFKQLKFLTPPGLQKTLVFKYSSESGSESSMVVITSEDVRLDP